MDRGDALDVFDVLPRRAQRRVVVVVVAVVAAARFVAPGLHLGERVVGWVVDARTDQLQEIVDDMLASLVPDLPTSPPDPPAPR